MEVAWIDNPYSIHLKNKVKKAESQQACIEIVFRDSPKAANSLSAENYPKKMPVIRG